MFTARLLLFVLLSAVLLLAPTPRLPRVAGCPLITTAATGAGSDHTAQHLAATDTAVAVDSAAETDMTDGTGAETGAEIGRSKGKRIMLWDTEYLQIHVVWHCK